MTEPAVVALSALYQLTRGDTGLPVPLSPDLERAAPLPDLIALLEELTHRGLIRTQAPNLVFMNPSGVRALFIKQAYEERRSSSSANMERQESQDIEIEDPEDSDGDDEVELGDIMDIVRDGARRTRGQSGVRPPPKSNPAPARERLEGLEAELDALTKDLALNADLSLPQWTQALELRVQVSKLLDTIRRIVEPRRGQ